MLQDLKVGEPHHLQDTISNLNLQTLHLMLHTRKQSGL